MTFRAEYNDTRPTIAAGTAQSGGLVYEWPSLPVIGGADRFYIAARTGENTLTAYAELNNVPTTLRGRIGKAGANAASDIDAGNVHGGRTPNPTSTAVGVSSVTGVQSDAVGAGAAVTGADVVAIGFEVIGSSDAAVVIGRAATAGNAGTAVGRSSSADGQSAVALGYNSNADLGYGVAVGENAKASLNAVAVGSGADASGYANSVALGKGTVTGGPDQVAVGDRDVEIQSLTKGLILRSPDGTRYRLRVANGGSLTVTAL